MANILAIDDEGNIADAIRFRLQALGHNVKIRADARSALTMLEEDPGHFALVITDWHMYGMSGVEFIQSVRLLKEFDHLKLILYTSADEEEQKFLPLAELEKWGVRIQKKEYSTEHTELLKLVAEMLA